MSYGKLPEYNVQICWIRQFLNSEWTLFITSSCECDYSILLFV